MRFIALVAAPLLLAACAAQEPKPAPAPAAAAPAPAAKKAPQCYSGDAGKFFNVGEKTTIAGVAVECTATSDGKAGQWMGAKH